MSTIELYGYLSVFFILLSRGIYLTSIFKGVTQPHPFSWIIWCLLSSIGFAAQFIEGAGAGSWARGFGAATGFIILGIALYKNKIVITRSDWMILLVSLAAIPLWIITKTPVWSVILVCIIDTLGYYPTVRKSWLHPRNETALGYIVSGFGAFFALLAIEQYTISTWLYSAVLVLTNWGLAAFLLARRRMLRSVAAVTIAALALFMLPAAGHAADNSKNVQMASALLPEDYSAPTDLRNVKAAKIVVYKSERRMDLLDKQNRPIRSYLISLGKNPLGDKVQQGDGRTPEGKYTIDARNDSSKFHLSLRISYPNPSDKWRAKKKGVNPGGDIFIHGLPNGKAWKTWKYNKSKDWTDGCIAVYDHEMREIWNMVDEGTPIIIRP